VEEGQPVEQRAAEVGGVPVPAGFAIWYSWQSEPSAEEDIDLRGIDRDVAAGHDVPFAM
jgi:hypothetical protein